MNRRDLGTVLSDLDELLTRAADADASQGTLELLNRARMSLYLDTRLPERDSVPPLLESNSPTRTKAEESFRKARAILKGTF